MDPRRRDPRQQQRGNQGYGAQGGGYGGGHPPSQYDGGQQGGGGYGRSQGGSGSAYPPYQGGPGAQGGGADRYNRGHSNSPYPPSDPRLRAQTSTPPFPPAQNESRDPRRRDGGSYPSDPRRRGPPDGAPPRMPEHRPTPPPVQTEVSRTNGAAMEVDEPKIKQRPLFCVVCASNNVSDKLSRRVTDIAEPFDGSTQGVGVSCSCDLICEPQLTDAVRPVFE